MSWFGSSDKKSSVTDNTASSAQQENNSGFINNGGDNNSYYSTDHGAVSGALASNSAISQSALLANVEATKSALNSNSLVSAMAFDFGGKALDANNYTTGLAFDSNNKALETAFNANNLTNELAFENSANALDTVSGFGESVIDKINDLATTVLVNGEKATRGALELAKTSTQSEAANITELMMKAGMILGVVAIVGAVVARGRK